MKKLMIAAVAMAAAVVANAANCKWNITEAYEYGSSSVAEGYAAYFFDAADYAYSSAESALAKGDLSFLSNMSGTAVRYTDEDGYVNGVSKNSYVKNQVVNGYVVVLDADSIDDAAHAYLYNGTVTFPDMDGADATMKFGSLTGMKSASTVTSGNGWYAVGDVPEPTSAMLLLLGVAGLALQRRRA